MREVVAAKLDVRVEDVDRTTLLRCVVKEIVVHQDRVVCRLKVYSTAM